MSSKKSKSPLSVAHLRDSLQQLIGPLPGKSLIVAFSGGVDSRVLLHLLAGLRSHESIELGAIHVNHGIHKDADAWEVSCRNECEKLNVPLTISRVDVVRRGSGIEAAAREARYKAFGSVVTTADHVLLTAHHIDDQAETLLLHLVRGAGVSGLAAMPKKRSLGTGQLARPLLDYSRSSILEYAIANSLSWVEDDSNIDPLVRRSFIRQEIFPRLSQRWPGTVDAFARTAKHMAEAELLLRELADQDLADIQDSEQGELSVSRLRNLSTARLRNLLRQWLRLQGARMPSAQLLEQLCDVIKSPPASARAEIFLGDGRALVYRDRFSFMRGEPALPTAEVRWDLTLAEPVRFGDYTVSMRESVGSGLSRERVGNLVSLRPRAGGERCRLPGRAHHSSLKNLFQDSGIAPWERDRLPLLYVGGELAAIGDRWVCHPYQAQQGEPSWELRLSKIA